MAASVELNPHRPEAISSDGTASDMLRGERQQSSEERHDCARITETGTDQEHSKVLARETYARKQPTIEPISAARHDMREKNSRPAKIRQPLRHGMRCN
jgi:hypothetical protein